MGKFKDHIYRIDETDDMHKLTTIIDDHLEKIKTTYPQEYNRVIDQIEKLVIEKHFDETSMEHAHKHIGEHYSVVASNVIAEEDFEIDFKKEKFNEYDFNYAINNIYRIFHNVVGDNDVKYAELSLAWLDDKTGKPIKHFKKMILKEDE